jgi:hypothetical protein
MKGWSIGTCILLIGFSATEAGAERTDEGLLVLYDFASADGTLVKDRSGAGSPINLRITQMQGVKRSKGQLEIRGKTLVRSEQPATRVTEAIQRSGALSVEAWIEPFKGNLTGPARIVSLSGNTTLRNFTLGQDGDAYDCRLRASRTSNNGLPALASQKQSLVTRLTHVVYTRDRDGQARIYLDGKQNAARDVNGDLENWDKGFHLALANEQTGDRPWQGRYHLVALYNRSLDATEVLANYRAGGGVEAKPSVHESQRLFTEHAAPIIARHCLECHDAATREGKLDLSRKTPALAGGKHGKAIVPGKSAESRLWKSIASDEMPDERPALSKQEKERLKQWIDSGAAWPRDFIDPAIYARGDRDAKVWLQRLTVHEYIETVKATLGVDITAEARRLLPPDLRADGFSNTAYNLGVDFKHVQAYSRMAEHIVRQMDVIAFARRFGQSPKLTDKNMRALISNMGAWVLRAPLRDHELNIYRGISTTVASTGGDFEEALRFILETMLQSPRFIYRVENQRGDGSRARVDAHELASRLSYIIWGSSPDQALMQAAKNGGLLNPEGFQSQVQRMLDDRRAAKQASRFLYEWLDLARLDHLAPDQKRFPGWSEGLASDMRNETLAFFIEVAWKQKRPLSDLFNARLTFATPELARHYGLKPRGEGMQRYDLSGIPARGGLLTQGAVLSMGGDQASMVTRGLFVFHELLRGVVNSPPPCIDTTPVPSRKGLTQRGVAEERIANKACGGCHAKFEPLAFGLEKFDGLGGLHQRDPFGNRLRDDGEVLVPGAAQPTRYRTSRELMDLLASSERVRESITWKFIQFALGRPLTPADAVLVDKVHRAAQDAGGTYMSLVTALVSSDLVQKTRTEPTE